MLLAAATPPVEQPAYAAVAMADRAAFENFNCAGCTGSKSGACTDRGQLRPYALFLQGDDVIDARYAVQSDACGSQSYTPFDVVTGVLGQPTVPRQPPLY